MLDTIMHYLGKQSYDEHTFIVVTDLLSRSSHLSLFIISSQHIQKHNLNGNKKVHSSSGAQNPPHDLC